MYVRKERGPMQSLLCTSKQMSSRNKYIIGKLKEMFQPAFVAFVLAIFWAHEHDVNQ